MMLRIIAYCLLCGAAWLIAAAGTGSAPWWYVAGVVYAAAFVPVALHGPQRLSRRLGVIWPAAIMTSALCVWTEGLIFLRANPHPWRALAGSVFLFSVMSVALAAAAGVLGMGRHGEPGPRLRRPRAVVVGVLVAGAAYAVYYFVFGGIFFQLLTKPYYTGSGLLSDAQEVVRRLGLWFPLIQVGRGALMTLAVLPIIASLRMSRRSAAVVVGMLLWVIGGLALLIPPNDFMPLRLRMFHTAEIFTQNFLLGATAVLLTRRADTGAGFEKTSAAEA